MPLSEVVGKEGTVAPSQILSDVPKLNVGVIFGLTVTVNVVGLAHNPSVGVNVYTPEAWLSTSDGSQYPVMPLSEVLGKEGTVPPPQITSEVPKLKVGVTLGLTVTLMFTDVPHCPTAGVNV